MSTDPFDVVDGPTGGVAPLPPITYGNAISVLWSAQDRPGGPGIKSYDVYISVNGGPFQPFLLNTNLTTTQFTGHDGYTYSFYSIATDYDGVSQPTPSGRPGDDHGRNHAIGSQAFRPPGE